MKKGVIFTIDALVAVSIAIFVLFLVAYLMSVKMGEWYREIPVYDSAQDFLTSTDKDGTLVGIFNQTDAAAISNLNYLISYDIPSNMVARINITIYQYSNGNFVCSRNFTAGATLNSSAEIVARRVFTSPADNSYGIAVMEEWYR